MLRNNYFEHVNVIVLFFYWCVSQNLKIDESKWLYAYSSVCSQFISKSEISDKREDDIHTTEILDEYTVMKFK